MIFENDFLDFINLLNRNEAKFVLVGGLAVNIHGHFRTTKDMDIFYESSIENATKVLKTINQFGFGVLRLTVEDLLDSNGYIQLGYVPIRIDLFGKLPGIEFEQVYKEAIDYKDAGKVFKVIHINHLITNKLAVGRLQDMDDAKKLQKIILKSKIRKTKK